jgi:hypothetical protein
VVKVVSVDTTRYFVASAGVANSLPLFQLSVILLMPDTDILGGIYTARNTVLIIIAVILIVATAVSVAITNVLLLPLQTVSPQMNLTSRLRDVDDDSDLSPFGEIQNLQLAYHTMNTAFTRYVPETNQTTIHNVTLFSVLCGDRPMGFKLTVHSF